MGCCGCKLEPILVPLPKPLDSYFANVETELTKPVSIGETINDLFFDEIERVAVDMIEHATWTEFESANYLEIKSAKGSAFNPDIPVIYFKFSFQEILDIELVTRLLMRPDDRLTWDSSLESYEILKEDRESTVAYYVIKMPALFQKRDLVERLSIRVDGNRLRVAAQSVEGKELQKNCKRCKSYFNYQVVEHGVSGTELLIVSQVDFAFSVVQKNTLKLTTSALKSMAESLQKEVMARESF